MQLVEAKIGDKTANGTTTDLLKTMKISKSKALNVDLTEAASIRTIISRLHRETAFKFKTSKSDTGILVWRLK